MAFEKRAGRNDWGLVSSRGTPYKDVLRWCWRRTVSPDGSQVAATVRDFHTQLVRVQGL